MTFKGNLDFDIDSFTNVLPKTHVWYRDLTVRHGWVGVHNVGLAFVC